MKALLVLICLLAVAQARATTYFLSPTGSDSNSGLTTATPWLTPNHALNCGDVVQAAASTAYSYTNFQNFGPVSCAGVNIAWLQCITFDACKITVPSQGGSVGYNYAATGILINNSYWGLAGWEVSNPTTAYNTQACIDIAPGMHHIVIANNVVNVCGATGIGASADYVAVIGNAVYGAATSNTDCHSGINSFRPVQFDTGSDTHIYIAGNFVWGTTNPPGCFEGNGIITDTLDHYNSDCVPFTGGVFIWNNISVGNGGVGIRIEHSGPQDFPSAQCPVAPTLFAAQEMNKNTAWGNNGCSGGTYGFGQQTGGELQVEDATRVFSDLNLASASNQFICGDSYPENDGTYALNAAFQVANGDGNDAEKADWLYSPFGNQPQITDAQGKPVTNSTFHYAAPIAQGDPGFAAPSVPPPPSCAGFQNVPKCLATVIAAFRASTNSKTFGYQPPAPPSNNNIYPVPQWVCGINIPPGLITENCSS